MSTDSGAANHCGWGMRIANGSQAARHTAQQMTLEVQCLLPFLHGSFSEDKKPDNLGVFTARQLAYGSMGEKSRSLSCIGPRARGPLS